MRTRPSTVPSLILLTALLVAMAGDPSRSASSPQGGSGALFVDAVDRAAQERTDDPAVLRSRRVTVDLNALLDARAGDPQTGARTTLLLNLFDEASYTAVLDRIDSAGQGFTWVGHIPGIALSTVTLATLDGVMAGSVAMPEAIYAIRYAGGGVHEVSQVDQSAFLPELNPIPISVPEDIGLSRADQFATSGDSGSEIDLMVLYTPAAAAAAGGTSAIAVTISLGVSETNTSYANSGITQRLRLVYSGLVTHTERNDLAEDLYDLSNYDGSTRSTPLGNTAASLRNTYGVDLVTLVTAPASPNGCGIAWLMTSVGSGFAPYGFNVVERSCISPNYTFAHELGHNMGARHDWFVDNQTTPHTYAHGYVNTANRWRTIMAYNNLCPALLGSGKNCTRLLNWSNPGVSYNTAPMGIAGGTRSNCPEGDPTNTSCDADDHRTLNDTAFAVANFRQRVTVPVTVLTTSPTALRFAGTKAGTNGALTAVTPAQTVTVNVSGTSTAWTVSADRTWVQIRNGSGSGSGAFTVAIVNPANAIGGSTSLTATVTITPSNAGLSATTVPLTLTIDQTGGATAAPFGVVDSPVQSATGLAGSVAVTGWALDDVGVSAVNLYRNCLPAFEPVANCGMVGGYNLVYMGNADIVPGARPDVEAAYPAYPQASRAGWGYLLLTNMLPHIPNQLMYGGQGTITLYVFATDVEGHQRLLGRTTGNQTPTTVTLANDTAAKPFGAIDTPGQGETVSGTIYSWGWALTPDGNTTGGEAGDIVVPINGSTMWVWIDGAPVANVLPNMCRGSVGSPVPASSYCDDDVANIFGNPTPQALFTPRSANATKYRNLDAGRGAIGVYTLDTTKLSNGRHSIVWSVTDSAGRVDGIGSRDFIVLNSRSSDVGRSSRWSDPRTVSVVVR